MGLDEILLLRGLKGVGDSTIVKLLNYLSALGIDSLFDKPTSQVDELVISALGSNKRSQSIIECIFSEEVEEKKIQLQQLMAKWAELNVKVITFSDFEYPECLKELKDPPPLLFCVGNTDLLQGVTSIAVVGTRQNTALGKVITEKTVKFLCSHDCVIVSGLAIGIDTEAHVAALNEKGKTIAVLVDVLNISPPGNRQLAKRIVAEEGLLVSENPPETTIIPSMFAKRDRIQAGLSQAVFAIETSTNGGTMHAVRTALDLNRDVYVPDPILAGYNDLGANQISGTQKLIEDRQAKAYTKSTYPEVLLKIKSKI